MVVCEELGDGKRETGNGFSYAEATEDHKSRKVWKEGKLESLESLEMESEDGRQETGNGKREAVSTPE